MGKTRKWLDRIIAEAKREQPDGGRGGNVAADIWDQQVQGPQAIKPTPKQRPKPARRTRTPTIPAAATEHQDPGIDEFDAYGRKV